MQTVLIIDDDANHRLIYRLWIEKLAQYRVVEAWDARSGYEAIVRHSPAVVLLDYRLHGEDGFQMLNELRRSPAECPPVIFMSCSMEESLRRNALALGASACFDKSGIDHVELIETINATIEPEGK